MAELFESKVAVYGPRLMADFGLTAFQAAGAFGNIGHECNGFRTFQEAKPLVPGSRGGFGWMQWTGPRRKLFEAYCERNRLDPKSDAANYAFLFVELSGPERASLLALKRTTTLSEATDVICKTNLRPGIVHADSRLVWAKRADKAIAGAKQVALPSGQPNPKSEPIRQPTPKLAPAAGLWSWLRGKAA